MCAGRHACPHHSPRRHPRPGGAQSSSDEAGLRLTSRPGSTDQKRPRPLTSRGPRSRHSISRAILRRPREVLRTSGHHSALLLAARKAWTMSPHRPACPPGHGPCRTSPRHRTTSPTTATATTSSSAVTRLCTTSRLCVRHCPHDPLQTLPPCRLAHLLHTNRSLRRQQHRSSCRRLGRCRRLGCPLPASLSLKMGITFMATDQNSSRQSNTLPPQPCRPLPRPPQSVSCRTLSRPRRPPAPLSTKTACITLRRLLAPSMAAQ